MDAFQIILLVLGVAIFVVSFFLPGGKRESTGDIRKEEKRIRELMDEEVQKNLSQMSARADELLEEKCAEAIEKAERGLERVSNEKMMAVSEYADTVLADISKNHEEVVFLYSMLGDKQKELKDDVALVDKGNKEARKRIKELGVTIKETGEAKLALEEAIKKKIEEAKSVLEEKLEKETEEAKLILEEVFRKQEEDRLRAMEVLKELEADPEPMPEKAAASVGTNGKKTAAAPKAKADNAQVDGDNEIGTPPVKKKIVVKKVVKNPDAALDKTEEKKKVIRKKSTKLPEMSAVQGENSNDMILRLYKEGKSNVAIAKELGLGVGEVKLVIDLFKQS